MMPPSSIPITSTRSSLPWKTIRIKPEENPYLTSDLSLQHPYHSKQASTSYSACNKMGVQCPLSSETNLTPTSGSALSAPCISSRSSGTRSLGLPCPELDFPQKMLGHTLYITVGPWSCTFPGSWISISWPSDDGPH